jgi:hypothetical protein
MSVGDCPPTTSAVSAPNSAGEVVVYLPGVHAAELPSVGHEAVSPLSLASAPSRGACSGRRSTAARLEPNGCGLTADVFTTARTERPQANDYVMEDAAVEVGVEPRGSTKRRSRMGADAVPDCSASSLRRPAPEANINTACFTWARR